MKIVNWTLKQSSSTFKYIVHHIENLLWKVIPSVTLNKSKMSCRNSGQVSLIHARKIFSFLISLIS